MGFFGNPLDDVQMAFNTHQRFHVAKEVFVVGHTNVQDLGLLSKKRYKTSFYTGASTTCVLYPAMDSKAFSMV